MDQIKIGAFLRTLRKEKNLTQEQLAEQLGVSGRTISRWETGSNMPDISLLAAIAEIYDVSIPEIIDGERKSEKMTEEVKNVEEAKEVADKMADYAGNEKAALLKNIRTHSLFGVGAVVILLILQYAVPEGYSRFTDLLRLYCETLIYVVMIMICLISTGLIRKFERKEKETHLPKPVVMILCAVAAFVVAVVIKFILAKLMGV